MGHHGEIWDLMEGKNKKRAQSGTTSEQRSYFQALEPSRAAFRPERADEIADVLLLF